MADVLVLADDLTGTLDCAVQFSKKNIDVSVCSCYRDCCKAMFDATGVLVVNTDSRHVSSKEAADRVSDITALAKESGVKFYYKKIDSLLRGNISAECLAMMNETDSDNLYILPSFPQNGRITKHGVQFCNGIPVTEALAGQDAFSKPKSSNISWLMELQGCKKKIESIEVSSPFPAGKKDEIYVFDALEDDDLRARALEMKSCDNRYVVAGCAGFAEFIPLVVDCRRTEKKEVKFSDNTLILSGSLNRISTDQINEIEKLGNNVRYLSYKQLKSTPETITEIERNAIADIKKRHLAVIATSGESDGNSLEEKDMMGKVLADIANTILMNEKDCNLVVFGGDTAMNVINELEARAISPVCEVQPGVVCSMMSDSKVRNRIFITKSGAFGDKKTIPEILTFLKTERSLLN